MIIAMVIIMMIKTLVTIPIYQQGVSYADHNYHQDF